MVTQGTCSIGKKPLPQKRLKAGERRIQLLRIAKELFSEHGFLRNYITKRQKRGAFQKCDPKPAAHAIIGIPSYYGLAKILFGVDNLTIPEDQMTSGFARIIL